MAWTQSHIDAIDDALRNHRLTVRDADGKQVTYRSAEEMLKVRALAVREVNRANAPRGPSVAVWK